MQTATITASNFNHRGPPPIKRHRSVRIWVSIFGLGCFAVGAQRAMAATAAASSRVSSGGSVSRSGGGAFTTVKETVRFEKEIKKSKFVAFAGHIADEQSAQSFLSQVREQRATHNCWAYKEINTGRMTTVNLPEQPENQFILQLNLQELRVMVVVIRYFGGIKLGTGGLVRAYGGVASECLKSAPTCLIKSKVRMGVEVPFDLMGVLYHQLQSFQVEDIKQDYDTGKDGITMVTFQVDFDRTDKLEDAIKNNCSRRYSIL